MPNLLTCVLLFLSSYFPLALIFFVLFVGKQTAPAVGIFTVATLGLIGMWLYLRVAQQIAPMQVTVAQIQRRDGEAMSYLVTYLVPFLAAPFNGLEQGVALFIFFLVLGILYVNSHMMHINPMLNLDGYHVYEITSEHGTIYSLITRRRVRSGEKLSVIKMGEDILLEKVEKP
ncbi:MAG: hypothetical protein M3347_07645 [Armatimonadota bacterium]|nr:hypothetical protein [Armatimonadota bacterium]